MDLVTLNEQHQQGKLIENYDSLLWTERFNTIGDFQLITGNVSEFLTKMPLGQVVSLRESTVPMIVERHLIERKKNQPVKLTIKGRDYVSILDRRVAIKALAAALSEWTVVAKIPSDVAHYVIYKICVEGILDARDIFPESKVQFLTPDDYLSTGGPNRKYTVPRGNLLEVVLQFIQIAADADPTTIPPSPEVLPHGIRAMRPTASGTAVGIEIYTGRDLSDTIVFDGTRDLLDDGTYLFSREGSATDEYVLGPNGSFKIGQNRPFGEPPSGLDRRVKLTDSSTTDNEALKNEGIRDLSKAHVTALYDGAINQDLSPYKYNVDYNLGDIVKLEGDYGLVEKARVIEYIRSEDATGSRSYPTLSAIDQGDLE